MILPTKHLDEKSSLLQIGANILSTLDKPKTVSRLWHDVKETRVKSFGVSPLSYDWFVLALDMLYAVQAIEYRDGLVERFKK